MVPGSFEGLVEVTSSLIDDEDAETAVHSQEAGDISCGDESDMFSDAQSCTYTACSETFTASDDDELN